MKILNNNVINKYDFLWYLPNEISLMNINIKFKENDLKKIRFSKFYHFKWEIKKCT
jgi:hypothetical protein